MKTKIITLLAGCILLAGCVHLPSISQPATLPTVVPNGVPVPAGTLVQKVTLPATASESTKAIQRSVNWQAGLFIIAGVACLALAGFLGYSGQIVPAIKVGVAGILLPIFGIWFAYHWLLVVIVCLLGAAAFFVATDYAVVKPILARLDAAAEKADAWLVAQAKRL
jgi:hypothetical protein